MPWTFPTKRSWKPVADHQHRDGWTLLELLVVLTLMAMITAGSHVMLRNVLSRNRHRGERDAILLLDRSARSTARRYTRPCLIRFAWDPTARLHLEERVDGTFQERSKLIAESLEDLQILEAKTPARDQQVPIDLSGRSPTYVLRFRTSAAERTWVVVAGETGQPILDLKEKEIHELAALLQ